MARGCGAGQGDAGVGLDQGELRREDARDSRGSRDAVRLGGDQAAQRGEVERRRLVDDRAGEDPAAEGSDGEGGADGPTATASEAVEERTDQRSDNRERQHGEDEEQGHLPGRIISGHREEQGSREGDGDRRVSGGVERVQLQQA